MRASFIVVLGELAERYLAALPRDFETICCQAGEDLQRVLDARAEEIEGVILVNEIGVSAETIDRLPNLKVISNYGAGYDDIDLVATARRGIAVSHTPGVLSDDVADIAIALILMTVRRLTDADRFVRKGTWASGAAFPLTPSLSGQTLGVIGYGGVGRAAARRAAAFGLEVAYHSRRPLPGEDARYFDNPVDLAAHSDILLVAAPGGTQTHHMVDADVLRALGRGVLVNVGRGSVVDTQALVTALETGLIMGAGLDVVEGEPIVHPRLLELENVVVLPHLGAATTRARDVMARLAVDNIVSFFDDGRVLTPIPEMREAWGKAADVRRETPARAAT